MGILDTLAFVEQLLEIYIKFGDAGYFNGYSFDIFDDALV